LAELLEKNIGLAASVDDHAKGSADNSEDAHLFLVASESLICSGDDNAARRHCGGLYYDRSKAFLEAGKRRFAVTPPRDHQR
jgi:hypothetical protein